VGVFTIGLMVGLGVRVGVTAPVRVGAVISGVISNGVSPPGVAVHSGGRGGKVPVGLVVGGRVGRGRVDTAVLMGTGGNGLRADCGLRKIRPRYAQAQRVRITNTKANTFQAGEDMSERTDRPPMMTCKLPIVN
jgi:hypothetical protein